MISTQRTVVVEEVPERCDARREREFVGELEKRVAALVRPAVVLDCSRVRQADTALVHLLLSCLEEALKRNGDVRLAGIRAEVLPALEAAGVGRLFRLFPSNAEAVESFGRLAAGHRGVGVPGQPAATNAA